jgi:hypothetical protein
MVSRACIGQSINKGRKQEVLLHADHGNARTEVGAFYWTALAPEIVNSGQEELGSVSV